MARLALHVIAIEPALAAEEAFAQVGDVALDGGLALGVAGEGGVDHEAAVAGVLGEGALEEGLVAVGLGDGGFEVVQDDPGGHPVEEGPRVLEPLDQIRQLLGVGDVDVLVAAVGEGHEQRVQHALALGLAVPDATELSEVDLGAFTRGTLRHAHGEATPLLEATVLGRETMQGAVGDLDPLASQ